MFSTTDNETKIGLFGEEVSIAVRYDQVQDLYKMHLEDESRELKLLFTKKQIDSLLAAIAAAVPKPPLPLEHPHPDGVDTWSIFPH